MWKKKERKEKLYSTFCWLAKYFKEEKKSKRKTARNVRKIVQRYCWKVALWQKTKNREMFIVFYSFRKQHKRMNLYSPSLQYKLELKGIEAPRIPNYPRWNYGIYTLVLSSLTRASHFHRIDLISNL